MHGKWRHGLLPASERPHAPTPALEGQPVAGFFSVSRPVLPARLIVNFTFEGSVIPMQTAAGAIPPIGPDNMEQTGWARRAGGVSRMQQGGTGNLGSHCVGGLSALPQKLAAACMYTYAREEPDTRASARPFGPSGRVVSKVAARARARC